MLHAFRWEFEFWNFYFKAWWADRDSCRAASDDQAIDKIILQAELDVAAFADQTILAPRYAVSTSLNTDFLSVANL